MDAKEFGLKEQPTETMEVLIFTDFTDIKKGLTLNLYLFNLKLFF